MKYFKSILLVAFLGISVGCKTVSSEIKADPADRGILVSAMKDMGISNLSDQQLDMFADHLLEQTRPMNPDDTTIDPRNNYAEAYMEFRNSDGGDQEKLQDWLTAGLAAYSNYIEMQLNGGVFLLRNPYQDGE